jgi:uncharacterized protein
MEPLMDASTWVPRRTILLDRAGSHAYGTAMPTSDEDSRGIVIAPRAYLLGSMMPKFENYQPNRKDLAAGEDVAYTELRHYSILAANNNPNVLELMFTDRADWLQAHPLGEELVAHRHLFLSSRCRFTFSGYAISQLKRIQTHRRWLLNPPAKKPERTDFDLPEHKRLLAGEQYEAIESMIRKKLDQWTVALDPLDDADQLRISTALRETLVEMAEQTRIAETDAALAVKRLQEISAEVNQIQTAYERGVSTSWDKLEQIRSLCQLTPHAVATDDAHELYIAAARSIGLDSNVIAIVDQEKRYQTAQQQWGQYQDWLKNRNPARAALEAQHGYDCKHGSHLVRLMRVCAEILKTGEIHVKRPDAAELLSIRQGAWSYDRLIEWAREQDAAMEDLYKKTSLPREPKRAKINELIIELNERALRGELPE